MAPTEGEEETRNNSYLKREKNPKGGWREWVAGGTQVASGYLKFSALRWGSNRVSAALCKLCVFSVPWSWREYPPDKDC